MFAVFFLLFLFATVTAAACDGSSPCPFVFEELRKHKVNLAVLDALYERIFVEHDIEVKEGLEAHFRNAFERSFQDATGWLHLAVTADKEDKPGNLIGAAWAVHEDNFPEVERILRRVVLPLMDLGIKLKLRYHTESPKDQIQEMTTTMQRWKLEMQRVIDASLKSFETTKWLSFLPKRLDEFEAYVFDNWMLPSRAVEELEERLSPLYPFRSFFVVSYTTEYPIQSCSNGSETGTLHHIKMRGKEWNLAVFSIPANETVNARELLNYFMKVPKKATELRCRSQAGDIFKAMEFPCDRRTYVMVAVVPIEEGMFKYAVTERHWKQMKVEFVKRSFSAFCKMSYALIGIGGDWKRM